MWYSQGTVAATNDSNVITGTGTAFIENVRIGDGITIQGSQSLHEVIGIASNAQLTIRPAYNGPSGSGKQYAIAPVLGYDKDLSDAFNRLRLEIGDYLTNLHELNDWVLDPTRDAIEAASQASDSASAAAQSEQASAQSATASAGSANAAAQSEQASGQSATDAAASAAAAAQSEQVASQKASDAAGSADAADQARVAAEQAVQEAEGLVPTETPGPGMIPKARAAGTLDPDWVPFSPSGKSVATGSAEQGRAALELGDAALADVVGDMSAGAIIERGSNANGEYVRFADGTQICTKTKHRIVWASAYRLGGTWTYPAAFISLPCVNVSMDLDNLINYPNVGEVSLNKNYSLFPTSVNIQAYRNEGGSAFSSNAYADVEAVAVGRWK
ncbi:hypothetical protein [Halopseudomonas pertucinogena]|uniref:Uncharacterized protein n=1 Tax=Halopseudomonas pertucinogena TaxID=86175 RepID=A0ABQ2CRS2_9GAMM|nr:hypothetical protein [Halopseudomonas pertucinogena]GGJ06696.1 hypothetical protein GCM10009083_24600 [Halopseudomonas pertucinogena]